METLGLATAGAGGLLQLAMEGAPVVGFPFHLAVRAGAPFSPGVLLIAREPDRVFAPALGAILFAAPPALVLGFTTGSDGSSPALLPLASVPAKLCGRSLVAQGVVSDVTAGRASVSKAARVAFGAAAGGPPFMPWATYTFEGGFQIRAGDLNGDQVTDLAVTGEVEDGTTGAVLAFLGAGDGTFAQRVIPTGIGGTGYPALGDLDRDGDNDLVVASFCSGLWCIVRISAADGGGFAPPETVLATDHVATSPEIGDLGGDGIPDIAYARWAESQEIGVLHGHGDGSFDAPVTWPAGYGPADVRFGDLDMDGTLDVATANFHSASVINDASVSILLNQGAGLFAAPVTMDAWTSSFSNATDVRLADLNLDGFPDMIALVQKGGNPGGLAVLLAQGGGSFAPFVPYDGPETPLDFRVGDVDRDLVPDVFVSAGVLYAGLGDGVLAPYAPIPGVYPGGGYGELADLDGDLLPDVAVGSIGNLRVSMNALLP